MLDEAPVLLKIAHLSDLHFSQLSFRYDELLSKALIGNLNLLLTRKRLHKNGFSLSLIDELKKQQVSHVLITGDLSTTSSTQEFEKAKEFIDLLKKEHMQVITIPGNHDNYTKASYQTQRFFQFMDESEQGLLGFELKKEKVSAHPIGENLWVVRLDTTHKTPVYLSTGSYTKNHDEALKRLLNSLTADDKVIIMNHFPLYDYEPPRRRMLGSALLRKTLSEYKQVKLYLHGHTHRQQIHDLRKSSLPITADCGSISHTKHGSWNLLEISNSCCHIALFKKRESNEWCCEKNLTYTWSYEETSTVR